MFLKYFFQAVFFHPSILYSDMVRQKVTPKPDKNQVEKVISYHLSNSFRFPKTDLEIKAMMEEVSKKRTVLWKANTGNN